DTSSSMGSGARSGSPAAREPRIAQNAQPALQRVDLLALAVGAGFRFRNRPEGFCGSKIAAPVPGADPRGRPLAVALREAHLRAGLSRTADRRMCVKSGSSVIEAGEQLERDRPSAVRTVAHLEIARRQRARV